MKNSVKLLVCIAALVLIGCAGTKIASILTGESSKSTESSSAEVGLELANNSTEMTYEERLKVFSEHCWHAPEGVFLPGWYVTYDELGERAPIEDIPGGQALEVAAACYAAYTLDFDVSLSDIIDTGFWPFDVFEDTININDRLYGFKGQLSVGRGLNSLDPRWQFSIGSNEWLVECKREILVAFYRNFYFDGRLQPVAELHAEIYPAFWFNPIAGRPMKSGEADGDIVLYPLSVYWSTGDAPELTYDFSVLQINYPTGNRSFNSEVQGITQDSVKLVSSDADCCLFDYQQMVMEGR